MWITLLFMNIRVFILLDINLKKDYTQSYIR